MRLNASIIFHMSIKSVLTEPNPTLRKQSKEIAAHDFSSEEIRNLITDMKDTMNAEDGVGIAAPQIGINKRLIVVDTGYGKQAFINPKIIKRSFRKIKNEEGCLSVPNTFGTVKRHRSIKITAFNEQGNEVIIKTKQFLATVFQHEIDHLDGVLFIDKIL